MDYKQIEKEFDQLIKLPFEGEIGTPVNSLLEQVKFFYRQKIKELMLGWVGEDLDYVPDNLRWGDSDYHSNSVRFGINQAKSEIRERIIKEFK